MVGLTQDKTVRSILGVSPPWHNCQFFVGACSVHCRVFGSISTFCPLDPNSIPSPSCDNQNVSRHCQVFSRRQNCPWLKNHCTIQCFIYTEKKRSLLHCDPQLYAGQFRRLFDLNRGPRVLICLGKSCFIPVVTPQLLIAPPFPFKSIQVSMTNFKDTIGLSRILRSSQLEKRKLSSEIQVICQRSGAQLLSWVAKP